MIAEAEIADAVATLGVDADQIRRDHLISHVLFHASEEEFVFFGGTALCRTHLAGRRLSEDIDLLVDDHDELSARLEETLPRALRHEFPSARWEHVHRTSRVLTVTLNAPEAPSVKIQIVRTEPHEKRGEYERRDVVLRYSDLPVSVPLMVPTLPTFTAMKLSAWADRKVARDLFDLAGLAEIGAIDARAVEMHQRLFGYVPVVADFTALPAVTAETWTAELDHQTAELPEAEVCLSMVRAAVEAAP